MDRLFRLLRIDCKNLIESSVKYLFLFLILVSIVIRSILLSTIGEMQEQVNLILSEVHDITLGIGGGGGMVYLGFYLWCKDRGEDIKSDNERRSPIFIVILGLIFLFVSVFDWFIELIIWFVSIGISN